MRPQGSAETITMSKDLDTGSVREARMEAKKLARKGVHTHQQALDHVARDRGHRNWSAFLSSEGQGGVRGGSPEPRKPRVATDRDLQEEAETRYLEDAADLRQDMPSWSPRLASALGGAWWLFLLLMFTSNVTQGLAAFASYFVLTLGAAAAAGRSGDGLLQVRRRISSVGTVLGIAALVLAAGLYAYGLLYYGHHHVLGTAFSHPLFDHGSLAYVVGLTTLITSHRMHRAMTVAVPDSVRPASREDLVVEESEPVDRPRLAKALALALFGGTGLAGLGTAGMIGLAGVLLVTHEMHMTAFGVAIGVLFAGLAIAMPAMMWLLYLGSSGTRPMQAARHRAARARRLLQAGRKTQTA